MWFGLNVLAVSIGEMCGFAFFLSLSYTEVVFMVLNEIVYGYMKWRSFHDFQQSTHRGGSSPGVRFL